MMKLMVMMKLLVMMKLRPQSKLALPDTAIGRLQQEQQHFPVTFSALARVTSPAQS